jgi:hypothetical protein
VFSKLIQSLSDIGYDNNNMVSWRGVLHACPARACCAQDAHVLFVLPAQVSGHMSIVMCDTCRLFVHKGRIQGGGSH